MNLPDRPDPAKPPDPRFCAWCGRVLPLPKRKNFRSTRVYCNQKCCGESNRAAHNLLADASPLRTDRARAMAASHAAWKKKP